MSLRMAAEPVAVAAPEGADGGEKERQGEPVAQRRGVPPQLGRRDRRQHLALGGSEHGRPADPALALWGLYAAAGQ